jgi:malto-oligosyltrehalose trehalohydrolase
MSTPTVYRPHTENLIAENSHGAEVRAGTVRFRLWAPASERVEVEIVGKPHPFPMQQVGEGWHELITASAKAGDRYRFVLPDGMKVPDPASRYQPEDVHGPSEIIDSSAWSWRDNEWRGRPWEEAVLYELHVGTFTPEGTFLGAMGKLDHLVALGVTAIEIMPISDFPGRRNWGYDGVLPYAPDSSYGRPEDLKQFIEAAHVRGLMVLLDVVYNHFGPDGNYLPVYAPQFFTERHKTPWGAAVNFDGRSSPAVRDFVIQNALYWVREFHFDGLRLDAVHAILDDGPKHILDEIAERVRAATTGRHVHLILENEENQAQRLERSYGGDPKFYTAQWNDDVHHVLHTAVTQEDKGYYVEYLGDTTKLGRALAEGFAFQGEMMEYRGEVRGEPCSHLPPTAFVTFLQNHDQIGNRAFGDRLSQTVPDEALRAAAAVYLLLPQIPMLFMGEEWKASQPFPFFCDFGPELADAVRNGRREEFARFPEFQDAEQRERIPDPQADATFASGKLCWDEMNQQTNSEWLSWYRLILQKRRETIVPLLPRMRAGGEFKVLGDGAVSVRWSIDSSSETLVLAANLSAAVVGGFPPAASSPIWKEGETQQEGQTLQPWTVIWSLES